MKFILAILFLLLSAPSFAQTQVTATKLTWDYLGLTPAQVAPLQQTIFINGQLQNVAPTCVAQGANTECSINSSNLNNTSANKIEIYTTNPNVPGWRYGTILDGLMVGSVTPGASNLRFEVTTTITIVK